MSDVTEIIRQAATRYAQSPETMMRIAQIESSLNPAAKNPKSSAAGLFQFVDPTWQQYGNGGDRFDPTSNADAAARLTRDNALTFRKAFGRDPSVGESYLMHQQGAAGALKLLQNPDTPAVSLVGPQAVRLNGGNDAMTARDFAQIWLNKAGGTAPQTPQSAPVAAPATQQPQMAEMPLLAAPEAAPLASVFAQAAQPAQKAPVRRGFNLAAVLEPRA